MQCFLKSKYIIVELSIIEIGELLGKLRSLRSCFHILPPGALTPQGIEGAMKRDVSKHWCTLQWCASRVDLLHMRIERHVYSIFYNIKCYLIDLYNYNCTIIDCYVCNNNNRVTNRLSGNLGPAAGPWSQAAARVVEMTASGVGGDLRTVTGFQYLVTILMDWPHPHTLFTMS